MKLINLDAALAEIEKIKEGLQRNCNSNPLGNLQECLAAAEIEALDLVVDSVNTLEVKEVNVWKTVNNINMPQADRNKIYCVFTKQQYILATIINHPQDEDLLQWKCTEFPHHRYDMCEGDKYMQII